jgi:hypothetical protein
MQKDTSTCAGVLPELLVGGACALRLDPVDLAAGFDLCLDFHDGFLVGCKGVPWRACALRLDPVDLSTGFDLCLDFHDCFLFRCKSVR